MPAQHSPAIPLDFVLPETMGSILQFCWAPEESQAQLETATVSSVLSTSTFKLYISGDTLLVDDLKEIPRRYTQIDLGLFHLGGTTIGLGLFVVTMDAIQGAACIKLIKPRTAIPIHFNDYDVWV